MASTSAFEIDFAADGAEAPGAVAVDGEGGAEAPFAGPADGKGAEEPVAAVTPAACLEPKMADTMLPKTLIFFLLFALLSHQPRLSAIPKERFTRARGTMRVKGQFAIFWPWVHLSLPDLNAISVLAIDY